MSLGGEVKRRRVLVIDDDVDVAELIGKVARKQRYDVRTINRTSEFRSVCHGYAPDLIFLDIVMPDMDGLELLRELARAKCRAEIVLISGFDSRYLASAKLLAETYGLKSHQVLTKPVDLDTLRLVMTRVEDSPVQHLHTGVGHSACVPK